MLRNRHVCRVLQPLQRRAVASAAAAAAAAASDGSTASNATQAQQQRQSQPPRRSRARLYGALCGAAIFPVAATAFVWYERRHATTQTTATAAAATTTAADEVNVVTRPQLGGPFCVRESRTGNTITDRDLFTNHWTLLYFGFSKCAEVCPTTLRFLADVLRRCDAAYAHDTDRDVAAAQSQLQAAFLSIDHIRDSPATMEAFVSSFGDPRIRGLCGTRAQVEEAARVWRVYYSAVDETDEEREAREAAGVAAPTALDDTYQFDHSAAIYLVGPDGKMRDFMFKEMGVDNAVDRLGVHFANVYGFNDTAVGGGEEAAKA